MIQLGLKPIAIAVARNQVHRLLGGAFRGGHRTQQWSESERHAHADRTLKRMRPCFDDPPGEVAVEIGPGDNLDLSQRLIGVGFRRVIAVEKYAHDVTPPPGVEIARTLIEDFEVSEAVDLIVSNDVLEHVDVEATLANCFRLLRPGGLLVSCVDLCGHNAFLSDETPLDFLTCPDWLYRAMHSHIETSNRVRKSELLTAAVDAGFRVERAETLVAADAEHLTRVRPHLLPRYAELTDEDLSVAEILISLRKPAVAKPR